MYTDKKFGVFHLFFGIIGFLIFEGVLLQFLPATSIDEVIVLLFSIIGAIVNMCVAIQAIEKVNSRLPMLIFLFLIVLEFITFFAFEYWYLILVEPTSFPTLPVNMLSFLLHSTMIFVFNPLHLPTTEAGNVLLLINTLSSFCIVIFILQNIWQLHQIGHTKKIIAAIKEP